jgi:hypothetical protein
MIQKKSNCNNTKEKKNWAIFIPDCFHVKYSTPTQSYAIQFTDE